MLYNQQTLINGNGDYSRDFTYVDNVIHMNMLAMETESAEAVNQIYNTAGGERTSINDLAVLIQSFLCEIDSSIKDIKPIYGPYRNGDIPHSMASIEKARKLLGYMPIVCFKEGLKRTIDWYIENE